VKCRAASRTISLPATLEETIVSQPTPARSADRNLLFGILALLNDFITREQLAAAMTTWLSDKARPLGEILQSQGALAAPRSQLLEALVQEHLKQHGNDPQKSLAAVSSIGSLRQQLEQLADPDLHDSLAHVSAARAADDVGDPFATHPPSSVGTPTSSGQRFRILRPHAKGGLGQVSVALDEELHREVALKEIQARHAGHPENRARFVLEAEITGRLEHPSIVPVYGLGQYADGRPFYAMRFIKGDSLKEAVAHFHQADVPGRDPGERTLALRKLLGRFLDVCNAIAYAHSRGVLHRDLKPGNIMLGQYGETLVVDWGLAKSIGRGEGARDSEEPTLRPASASGSADTQAGTAIGTPQYMSPEQAAGRLDLLGPASDVYSLGATLYAVLTGRSPCEGKDVEEVLRQVRRGDVTRPRQLKAEVPAALEAICLKAMSLEPEARYGSPRALADDVEHWLADEPVSAWAEPWTVRTRRWLGRHRTVVTATAAAVLVAVALVIAALARTNEDLAKTNEKTALKALEERDRFFKSEKLLNQLQRIQLTTHNPEWSSKAWDLARQVAKIRQDDVVRDKAAATLAGIDASPKMVFSEFGASFVAFDPQGKRLVMGGLSDAKNGSDLAGAKLWDGATDKVIHLQEGGIGLIAFCADGTLLQFGPDLKEPGILIMRNLSGEQLPKLFKMPVGAKLLRSTALLPPLGMTPDGKLAAAAVLLPGGQGKVLLWDERSGKLLKEFATKARAIAFSPDGARLAAGAEDGAVTVWSLPDGEEVATLRASMPIHCLAFSRDPRRSHDEQRGKAGPGWLLASGTAGGSLTIWDVGAKMPRSYCHGSNYDVYAVAFSPDGSMLGSAGRSNSRLWDVATGRLLLSFPAGNLTTALAFSGDGRKVAFAHALSFGSSGYVDVWELERGRGIQTLRGFVGQVALVRLSPNGRYVAGLYHNWHLGIWSLTNGDLVHVLDVPEGLFADNAALAFNADGSQLAYTASKLDGGEGKLWDTATGKELKSWKLPPGLTNYLAFHRSGKLLHFQVETADGKQLPVTEVSWQDHPRVCRILDLLAKKAPLAPIVQLNDFRVGVGAAAVAPDGSYFAVLGIDDPVHSTRILKVFAGTTGAVLYSRAGEDPRNSQAHPRFDPTGKVLAFGIVRDDVQGTLVEMPTGKFLGTLARYPCDIGPEAKSWTESDQDRGISFYRGEGKAAFLILQANANSSSVVGQFNRAGTIFAFGNADGTVIVCDLPAVQRRLAEVGLSW